MVIVIVWRILWDEQFLYWAVCWQSFFFFFCCRILLASIIRLRAIKYCSVKALRRVYLWSAHRIKSNSHCWLRMLQISPLEHLRCMPVWVEVARSGRSAQWPLWSQNLPPIDHRHHLVLYSLVKLGWHEALLWQVFSFNRLSEKSQPRQLLWVTVHVLMLAGLILLRHLELWVM